ncbi:hypothetical protein [Streptomyces sp. ODS28]|uniref:hypothetical protein n=1 Tax=Streptomyces sp. ODS28 TaxID=3136688 RepID=UPI0031EB659A
MSPRLIRTAPLAMAARKEICMSRTTLSSRSTLATWLPVVGPVPVAAWFTWQMSTSYGLSGSATVAVALLAWIAWSRAVELLIDSWISTTHRCPAKGCTFSVRLIGADAAESRRWQEVAHDHPHHHG